MHTTVLVILVPFVFLINKTLFNIIKSNGLFIIGHLINNHVLPVDIAPPVVNNAPLFLNLTGNVTRTYKDKRFPSRKPRREERWAAQRRLEKTFGS